MNNKIIKRINRIMETHESKRDNLHILNIKPTNFTFQKHTIRPNKSKQRTDNQHTPIVFRSLPNIKTDPSNKSRDNKILTIILMHIKTISTLKTMPSILEFTSTVLILKTIVYLIVNKDYIS